MFCKSNRVKKNGKQTNKQRFKCLDCGKQFQFRRTKIKTRNKIWHEYVWGKQTASQLANKYNKSEGWIRKELEETDLVFNTKIKPQPITVVVDATFFGRGYGVLVFREPHLKKNIYFKEISSESPLEYAEGKYFLEKQGFTLKSVTSDGKRGVKEVFRGIPVQMCQFHQIKIINRYLTRKPKLPASIELRRITLGLTESNEKDFANQISDWHEKWEPFLKEKSFSIETGKLSYTHRKLRSAYRSLKTNLPNLFTYQKFPELNIPNTTNSLEGYFSNLKTLLRIHRGLTKKRRFKVISEILNN